jgi:hypothetical protein
MENTGTLLLSLSGGPGKPDVVMEGEFTPYTGPTDFNQLFSRANRGGLTIVLETDIPDRRGHRASAAGNRTVQRLGPSAL